jgi:hypothetical protein
MKKGWIILLITTSLISCVHTTNQNIRSEKEKSLLLLNLSSYASNVYVGISGPYSTQEKMVEMALISCAKSILLEEALALDNTLVMQTNSKDGLTSFAQKEKAYYDDSSLARVIDSLDVLSINFDEKAGAIVIAEYAERKATKRPYTPQYDTTGTPLWVKRYPEEKGFRFGIGSSKSYYYLHDSLEAADFSAAQNLLDLYSEHTFSTSLDKTYDDEVSRMESSLYQAQRGLLKGFSIVDRYYDKESDTFWSLASIKE